jgi:hypothetical protein
MFMQNNQEPGAGDMTGIEYLTLTLVIVLNVCGRVIGMVVGACPT